MAHYLPVLLVSVNANVVPDDNALVTLPRGQVDYLSHEWQEEDVWRSWRNMTRQKNAIANGARLENASWRTWWKQRNKLKTVSPETLNWLKDSDVTWLYGPLHTAVEWTPPPKPKPVPDSVDAANPASAHDRLDLSSSSNPSLLNNASARRPQARPTKPILKHRSIGELLTGGDYQPPSVYSPMESEDGEEDVSSPSSPHDQSGKPTRPTLVHTKSDTHIIRWGPNRAFRKDSPPRIDPPGFDPQNAGYFPPHDPTSSLAPSTSSSSQPSSSQPTSAATPGAIRASISQDSNSTSSGGHASYDKPEKQKKKHISFNTFVEQCIAIEKPKKNASGFFGAIGPAAYSSLYGPGGSSGLNSVRNRNNDGAWIEETGEYVDDDGYDEDEEEDEDEDSTVFRRRNSSAWQSEMGIGAAMGRAAGEDSDESPADETVEDIDEVVEDDEDDDGAIQIRSRSGSTSSTLRPGMFKTPKKAARSARSQSKVSTSSSSSATSTSSAASGSSQSHGTTPGTSTSTSPNSSLSPSRRARKNSATSTVSSGSNLTATQSTPDPSSATASTHEAPRKRLSSSSYRPTAPPGYIPSYHAHRPPLIRTPSEHQHVTIAPIAPTLLKTTGAWSEGFGDDASDDGGFAFYGWAGNALDKTKSDRSRSGSSSRSGSRSGSGSGERDSNNRQSARHHGRVSGFNSPTVDLDPERDLGIPTNGGGYLSNPDHGRESMRRGRRWDADPEDDEAAQASDGTPVELVYVPPIGSNYSFGGDHYGGGPYADGIYSMYGDYMGQRGEVEEESEEEEEEKEGRPPGVRDEDEDEGSADAVYHHPPLSSSPALGTTAPIPIASVTQYPPIPEVTNSGLKRSQSSQNFAVSTSAPNTTSFMHRRPSATAVLGASTSGVSRNVEEEDENDFFGGPDLGEDYYYARRGGRGYDRGSSEVPLPTASSSSNAGVPGYVSQGYGYAGTGYAAQMQRERERDNAQREREKRDRGSDSRSTPIIRTSSFGGGGIERRNSRSGRDGRDAKSESAGEERQGRSRSRSQSRTPSPAMLSSSSPAISVAAGPRKRSSSASSPAGPPSWTSSGNADLLSPPVSGSLRQSTSTSLLSSGRPSPPVQQSERQGRGRSSTRTPSSSLSPDGVTVRSVSTAGIGAILTGSGRVGREQDDDRRGRERRGRDRTSGKLLAASETERTPSETSKDGSTASGTVASAPPPVGGNMEASFYSTTSSGSSTSNASTIVGPTPSSTSASNPVDDEAHQSAIAAEIAEQNKQNELRYLRRAEEDQMRRAHPTPSNSPVVQMRHMAPPGVGETYSKVADVLLPANTVSSGPPSTVPFMVPPPIPSSVSSPKLRPPPIVPTTASPAKPSTSFVSSPRRSSSVGPPADEKFQALANIAVPSPTGNINPSSGSDSGSEPKENTIVGKAVDIVSSAGAFLGLWGREKEKTPDSLR